MVADSGETCNDWLHVRGTAPAKRTADIMTTRSSLAPPVTAASGDYTYEMQVHVPRPQIIEALTDDTVISRWWTAVTRSERHGDEVQLFMGSDAPFVFFTVEHTPGTSEVTWTVTDCAVMADWV